MLIHGVIMAVGGIPLIYLGDEIGTLNDYGYRDNPAHQNDSRWLHRPKADWERYAQRNVPDTIEGRVYQGLVSLIKLRKENNGFSCGSVDVIQTGNDHILGFTRSDLIILANFSETSQNMPVHALGVLIESDHQLIHGMSKFINTKDLTLEPLEFLVVKRQVRSEA